MRLLRLGERIPTRRQLGVFLGYAVASALYVGVGLFFTIDFVLSVFVAIAYLLAVVWLAPTLVRR